MSFAVYSAGAVLATLITIVMIAPPGSMIAAAAGPVPVPAGITRLIWPLEPDTAYKRAGRVVPLLSVTFTETPPSEVPKGEVAVRSPVNPGTPNRLAISSGATLAEILAAQLLIAGSGAEALGLKLLSPE